MVCLPVAWREALVVVVGDIKAASVLDIGGIPLGRVVGAGVVGNGGAAALSAAFLSILRCAFALMVAADDGAGKPGVGVGAGVGAGVALDLVPAMVFAAALNSAGSDVALL
jgi:hypothetical protein